MSCICHCGRHIDCGETMCAICEVLAEAAEQMEDGYPSYTGREERGFD